MTTSEIVSLIVALGVLGTVYPLIGVAWYFLVGKVNALEEKSITREVFRAHMRRLDESNFRIERAMGLLPRDRTYSQHDSEPPGG